MQPQIPWLGKRQPADERGRADRLARLGEEDARGVTVDRIRAAANGDVGGFTG